MCLVLLLLLFPVRLSDALTEVREGGDSNGEFRESPTQLALRSVGLERLVYLPFNESSQTPRDEVLAEKRAGFRQLVEDNEMLKGLTQCTSHDSCESASYCDTDRRCWSCRDLAGCCVLHDTFDKGECPDSCECSAAAYLVSSACDTSNWCKRECGSMDQCADNLWAKYKCPSQIESCTASGKDASCYCVTASLGPASIAVLVALIAVAACACVLVCMHSDYLLGTEEAEEGIRLMVAPNGNGFTTYGSAPVTSNGELPAAPVSEAEEYVDMEAAPVAEWRRSEPLASRAGEGGSIKMTSMQAVPPAPRAVAPLLSQLDESSAPVEKTSPTEGEKTPTNL